MRAILVLAACLAAVAAAPRNPQKIVGGSLTTINEYPTIAALLYGRTASSYSQSCGGTILNNLAILTAAHCTYGDAPARWRSRIGSSYANSGGYVHESLAIVNHPNYNTRTADNDVAILRLRNAISLSNQARPANIAGSNYNLGDNQVVWAAGWGVTRPGAFSGSEQLRHVQVWTVNQNVCVQRYNALRLTVTPNMLCSGWLDVGGRDQCQGDSGGPLYHNNVVVGVCSWGQGCAQAQYPGVNARVSRFTPWIQANA